jgi:radical SAM protein with 4Fe4S-binding SPASM domain
VIRRDLFCNSCSRACMVVQQLGIEDFLDYASRGLRRYIANLPRFGLPYAVQIEITTRCNLRCEMCARSKEQAGALNSDMPLDLFNSIVSKLRYPSRHVTLVGLGEPLLHPQLFSIIRSAKERGLIVSLISNFTLIDRETSLSLINSGLDYLFVSFDSGTKSVFEKIRTGASFEEVIDKVKLFVKTKKEVKAKTPAFFLKSTVSRRNSKEIRQLISLAGSLGVEGINFGKLFGEEKDYIHDPSCFLNMEEFNGSVTIIDPCEIGKFYQCDGLAGCYITFDGRVLPCGIMMQAISRSEYPRFQLGDLRIDTIDRVWRSGKFKQFRKQIKSHSQPYLPICEECPAWMYK